MSMRSSASIAVVLALAGCATASYPFPNREPLWVDSDRRPFAQRPAELFTPPRWDVVDAVFFRPISEVWTFERGREAINVNAVDEVPDSSWFENRAAHVTPEDVARGACESPPPPTPWRVIRSKTAGTRPGFAIRAADDRIYFLRTDETLRERSTAADAIATRLIWAAGYNTPCNHVAFFRPEDLVLAPEAEGEHAPTQDDIDLVLRRATRAPDGSLRVSLSQALEGEPLGGWQFEGIREDDLNDVVPHQHRRDARGMVLLSAWLNHIDSRAENNLDTWIETGEGRGYVRHYVLDASDSFGVMWRGAYLMSQRFGSSHYLDMQHVIEDFLTFGALDRPYYVDDEERGPATYWLGYYDIERFDPAGWRNGYPNAAFQRATERDRAWMARIIAHLDRDDVAAAIGAGRFSRALVVGELERIVMGRRELALERFLTRLSPLSEPVVNAGQLCLRDLAITGGIRDPEERVYAARAWQDWPPIEHSEPRVDASGDRACVRLPSAPASAGAPAYWIVDVSVSTPGHDRPGPARVHLYQNGPRSYRVVGLERPAEATRPG